MPKPLSPAGLLLLALALAAPASALAAGPSVVLTAPSEGVPLIGPVTISFAVHGIDAAQVASARVLLDGRVVATLAAPPWTVSIDAGDELRERRIEIILTLKDGRVVKTSRTSSRPPATEVEVRLVNLGVSVTDRSRKPVLDLTRGDFAVLDAGRPVEIERFETTTPPLAVAVVLDTSLSMAGDALAEAKRAARSFVEKLAPADRVMVVSFSDDVRTVVPLTEDHRAALQAVDNVQAGGGTALYDAVYTAATELAKTPPDLRRILVVLSDGRDEAASGLEPGSFHVLDEAIRQTDRSDVVVFSIGLGSEMNQTDFTGRLKTSEVLARMAQTTGGQYEEVGTWTRLGAAFRKVLDELRHRYWIAYRPAAPQPGETWRAIQVRISRPGLTARTREGYYVD